MRIKGLYFSIAKMKIIISSGGLGNQLFFYMFCKHIMNHSRERVYVVYTWKGHNGYEVDKFFECEVKNISIIRRLVRALHRFRNKPLIREFFIYEDGAKGRLAFIYKGFFQNKRYFEKDAIRFKNLKLSEKNQVISNKMLHGNSVAIHVRRGDYLSSYYKDWYCHLHETDYYQKAIEYVKDIYDDCTFYVFSDDIEWCKDNLAIDNASFIDWNKGDDCIFDMYLMSQTKVNIIANSTFSFWGAYLNRNSKLSIYPLKWYAEGFHMENPDIFPDDWIGL